MGFFKKKGPPPLGHFIGVIIPAPVLGAVLTFPIAAIHLEVSSDVAYLIMQQNGSLILIDGTCLSEYLPNRAQIKSNDREEVKDRIYEILSMYNKFLDRNVDSFHIYPKPDEPKDQEAEEVIDMFTWYYTNCVK